MKRKKILLWNAFLLAWLLLFTAGNLIAQDSRTISGNVKDSDGNNLPGVTVVVKGTTIGAVTDMSGTFKIQVPAGSEYLSFSFVGMEPQDRAIENNTYIEVQLQPSSKELDEVVVVGYGVQDKKSLISAISTISSDEITSVGNPNISNALGGLVPGLNTVVSTGQPGFESARLNIRGRSSIHNDEALIIVDGVEQVGDFSNIDPTEVESISVLKDAAATAVYGVKGANGVIIITTKRGRVGAPTISFNTETTFKRPTSTIETLNAYQTNALYNVGLRNDQHWNEIIPDEILQHYKDQDMPLIYPNVDWYNEVVKDFEIGTRSSLNASGGNEFVKYFTSVSYLHDADVFNTVKKENEVANYDPEFKFNKWNFRTNLDFQLTKSTVLKTDISGRVEETNQPGISANTSQRVYNQMYIIPPSAYPVYYPESILEEYPDPYTYLPSGKRMGYKPLQGLFNPLFNLNEVGSMTKTRNVFQSDIILTQKLNFIAEGLSVSGRYSYSSLYDYSRERKYTGIQYELDETNETWKYYIGTGGLATDPQVTPMRVFDDALSGWRESFYYEGRLNYNKRFNNHYVDGLFLVSRREVKIGDNFPSYNEDWVGRFSYNFKHKYFIESSFAYNGTNRFAPGKRFGFFPSVGAAWTISEEKFVQENLKWLDYMKVRYSIGQSGSEEGSTLTMYLGEYKTFTNKYNRFGNEFSDQGGAIYESILANPNATWETVTKQNLGIDTKVLNGKLSVMVDLFKEYRDHIFVGIPTATYFGNIASIPRSNVGEIKKHGMEWEVIYRDRLEFGLGYFVKGTYAFSENRMVKLAERSLMLDYERSEGNPIGVNRVIPTDGYMTSVDEVVNYVPSIYEPEGALPGDYAYADFDNNGVINDKDRVYQGFSNTPRKTLGLTIGADYKGFAVSAFLIAAKDYNYFADIGNLWYYPFQELLPNGRVEHLDYWQPDNLNAAWPTPHIYSQHKNWYTDAALLDASYVRLKNIDFSYSFKLKKESWVKKLNLYINGNNILTWSKIKNGDPEGHNIGNYPITKRYNIGLNATF